jgi:predicted O-methyltransferase YrrM
MNFQNYIKQLPELYKNWGSDDIKPKSLLFQLAIEKVQCMTTPNVMQLLNFGVSLLETEEIYCEVGCFQGATLVGAMLNNFEKVAYAIDNFSEFDANGENFHKLTENLSGFGLSEQIVFFNKDFQKFFMDFYKSENRKKIGVYFYDGAHDYRSQMLGLLFVKPFLADQAIIIIDDTNLTDAKLANEDFINTHPECKMLLDLPTPCNGHQTFWNGIQILSWDKNL